MGSKQFLLFNKSPLTEAIRIASAHAQFGLSIGLATSMIAWNQGVDLFKIENNLLRRGLEYTAKYNVNETVEYDPRYARCNSRLVAGPWPEISDIHRGRLDSWWNRAYEFYRKVKRQDVPWVKTLVESDSYKADPWTKLMYSR